MIVHVVDGITGKRVFLAPVQAAIVALEGSGVEAGKTSFCLCVHVHGFLFFSFLVFLGLGVSAKVASLFTSINTL